MDSEIKVVVKREQDSSKLEKHLQLSKKSFEKMVNETSYFLQQNLEKMI